MWLHILCALHQASVAYIIAIYKTEGVYKQRFNYIRHTYEVQGNYDV